MPVVDGTAGRAFDYRDKDVDAADVAAAIRGEPAPIDVVCPTSGPVHDRVGVVRPDRSYPLRAALAAVARGRGLEAPVDEELRAVRDELAALDSPDRDPDGDARRDRERAADGPPVPDLSDRRRRVAESGDGDGIAEEVATLRGQLALAREREADPDDLEAAMRRAVADLTERRTERIAAEQSLERARERARSVRDRRERRLALEDRAGNLERTAREQLAAAMAPSFERALAAVPGDARPADAPGRVDGSHATGALAVCRLAPIAAPVVVALPDRFPTATAACAALDAPVVLVSE